MRTEWGDEVMDIGTPKHCPAAGPPRPALTTAVLSIEAVGWMYTFPAIQSSRIRGGSSQEPLGSWEVLPTGPTASPGSPQGGKGSEGDTSDDGASRLVLGQPLWVAFAVLVQVKAAGIDSRAGGGKANAGFYVSGTIRAEDNLNLAPSTPTQGPAWALSHLWYGPLNGPADLSLPS